MSNCNDYPTPDDAKRFKNNADSTNEFVTSDSDTFVDQDGGEHSTIQGIGTLANSVIDEYRLTNKGSYSAGITLENKFEFITYNGDSYFATNPPYTTTATTPDVDGNLFVGGYTTLQTVTDTIGNPNRISNHNFLKASPDNVTPPSETPTDYLAGTQIFSGVFVGTDVVGFTYINGRVSWTNVTGTIYLSVLNTSGLEYINEFTASVADFDGKPRTRGVSYALVGSEYRITVGVDALEDATANPTPLGSVKFEQGSVATKHEIEIFKIDSASMRASELGIVADFDGTTGTDNKLAIERAMSITRHILFDQEGRYAHSGIITPRGCFISGMGANKTSLEMLPNPTEVVILHSHEGETLKIRDMTIDGSSTDGPFGGSGVFTEGVYCNLGNLDIDDSVVRRVNSYAIRSGNVELNFDQNKKAGSVYIGSNVLVDQLTESEHLGDCIRIERTRKFTIDGGVKLNGGLSSLRVQYYVDDITIGNIITKNNWGDVGITIALCTDFNILGSVNSGHASHGIELDGVRRGNANGFICHGNTKDGIVVAEYSPPAGANFEGFLDGQLITSSDVVYPEDIYIGGGAQCFNNGEWGSRTSKPNGVTYGDIKFKNNAAENVPFIDGACFVSGAASISGKDIQDVTFTDAVSVVNNENQIKALSITDYKVDSERPIKFYSKNIIGGSGERFQFPVVGGINLNRDNRLSGGSDISGTAIQTYDPISDTGTAWLLDDTSGTGDTLLRVKIPAKLRFNAALLNIAHHVDAGSGTLSVAVNLYNAGVYVETVFTGSVTSNPAYSDLRSIIAPSSASVVFDEVWVDMQTTVPDVIKIFINRLDINLQY